MVADPRQAAHAALDALWDALESAGRVERDSDAPDVLLSVDEAAARLGVGRSLLYDELGRGRLRSVKVGRRRLVPTGAIAAYAASSRSSER